MKRSLAVLAVWFGLAFAAGAVPARLPYMPEAPPKPPEVQVLAGSVWRGQLYDPNSRIVFNGDGTLTYGEPGGTTAGSWRLEGNKLFFEINKYSEYDTVLLGDVIQGEGWNKAGQRCKPLLKRIDNEDPVLVPQFHR